MIRKMIVFFLVLSGVIIAPGLVLAAPEFSIRSISLEMEANEQNEVDYHLECASGLDMAWLELNTDLSYVSTPLVSEENNLRSELSISLLPFQGYLRFNGKDNRETGTGERTVTKETTLGITVQGTPFSFLPGLKIGAGGKFVGRNTIYDENIDDVDNTMLIWDDRWHEENIHIGYKYRGWEYNATLDRFSKAYGRSPTYNNIKLRFHQQLVWKPTAQGKFQITYQETNTEYPLDFTYSRLYWEEKWQLTGAWELPKIWDTLVEFESKRRIVGFTQANNTLNAKAQLQVIAIPKIGTLYGIYTYTYSSTDLIIADEPEEMGEEENDEFFKKGETHSLKLGCRVKYRRVTVEAIGFYRKTYADSIEEKLGYTAQVQWEPGPLGLTLHAAPLGSFAQNDGYYTCKVVYRPR